LIIKIKKLLSFIFAFFLIASNLFAGTLEMDWMEYTTDGAAQAAWVSSDAISGYTADLITGGTTLADSEDSAPYNADKACDDDTGTMWLSAGVLPHWWQYHFASGKTIQKITLQSYDSSGQCIKNFTVNGSNNGSDWSAAIYTGVFANSDTQQSFTFVNSTSYSYYRINVTSVYNGSGNMVAIKEVEMMETTSPSLQDYSEDTTKSQGSYSLEVVALQTDSLNDTLTRTLSPTYNLSGVKNLKFDIRSNLTGANVKLGIHDSGGTTTEITPSIITANTFQNVNWDISAVSDANKDVIDSIIITIVNADSANTFYIDYFEIAQAIDVFGFIN